MSMPLAGPAVGSSAGPRPVCPMDCRVCEMEVERSDDGLCYGCRSMLQLLEEQQ